MNTFLDSNETVPNCCYRYTGGERIKKCRTKLMDLKRADFQYSEELQAVRVLCTVEGRG